MTQTIKPVAAAEAGTDAIGVPSAADRIQCSVVFCNRTRRVECTEIKADGSVISYPVEWLCAIHWPLIPKPVKQRHIQAKREFRRNPSFETASQELKAWVLCVAAAHEAATGH